LKCDALAEFGYRVGGALEWYCADHRLSRNYVDARVPTPTGEPVEGGVLLPKREIAFKPIMRKVECVACGAEADATFHPTCNCNAGFRSKKQMAAEAIEQHPNKSNRAIAAEIGADEKTVRKARADQSAPEPTVTGRDGKTYPSTRPKYEYDDDEPDADPFYDYEPDPEPKPKSAPLPPPPKLARDPLAEAAKLKVEIIALMKLMRPLAREQFKQALLA
jgi:hypothetical protein